MYQTKLFFLLPIEEKDENDQKNYTKNENYCVKCNTNFSNAARLFYHIKLKHYNEIPQQFEDKKQFQCDICSQIFFSPKSVIVHKKQKHGKKSDIQEKFQCPHCDKLISSKVKLRHDHSRGI